MAELTMNSERRLTTAGEGNSPFSLKGVSALILVYLVLIGESAKRGGLKMK